MDRRCGAGTTWRARCAASPRERRGENRHETRRRLALHLLGRLLRNPIQHRSARLRHDPPGGFDRARRAARLLFRRAPLRDPSPPPLPPPSPPPPPPPPPLPPLP